MGNTGMLGRLGSAFLLVTAVAGEAGAQGSARFDGQYMGELVLNQTIRGDCTQPPFGAMYPLKISRGEVRFAYQPRFGTTLIGKVGDNGAFRAAARTRNGPVQMTGRIQGITVNADIVSPSCHYTFQTRN